MNYRSFLDKLKREVIDQQLLPKLFVEYEGVEFRRSGVSSLVCVCPFHNDVNPSCSLTPETGFWYCFGCGANGDAISLIQESTGASFKDAITELAEFLGEPVPEGIFDKSGEEKTESHTPHKVMMEALEDFFAKTKLEYSGLSVTHPAKKEFLKRSLPIEQDVGYTDGLAYSETDKKYGRQVLIDAGLYSKNGMPFFKGRIIFPIRSMRGGAIVGFSARKLYDKDPMEKYVNTPNTTIFNKSKLFYLGYESRQAIRSQGYCLVVEGQFDALAARNAGIEGVVATMGTAYGEYKHRLASKGGDVVFCFDGDAAGLKAFKQAAAAGGHLNGRALILPDGLDPCDYVMKYGGEQFKEKVESSVSLMETVILAMRANYDTSTPDGMNRFRHEAMEFVSSSGAGPVWQKWVTQITSGNNSRPPVKTETRSQEGQIVHAGLLEDYLSLLVQYPKLVLKNWDSNTELESSLDVLAESVNQKEIIANIVTGNTDAVEPSVYARLAALPHAGAFTAFGAADLGGIESKVNRLTNLVREANPHVESGTVTNVSAVTTDI